jgi:hypothetical protein
MINIDVLLTRSIAISQGLDGKIMPHVIADLLQQGGQIIDQRERLAQLRFGDRYRNLSASDRDWVMDMVQLPND